MRSFKVILSKMTIILGKLMKGSNTSTKKSLCNYNFIQQFRQNLIKQTSLINSFFFQNYINLPYFYYFSFKLSHHKNFSLRFRYKSTMPNAQNPSKFQQLEQVELQQTRYGTQQTNFGEKHYGCCLIISRYSNGEPRYTLGPHGYIFLVALVALTSLFAMLINTMKQHLSTFWLIVMIISGVIFFFSYLNIGLSVPGFASRAEQASQQDKIHPKYCKPCKIVRTNDVYHCYDCDVCIQGYDHHCPWIGKCVGRQNLRAFYFFLIMTFGTLILSFIATVASNATSSKTNLRTDDTNPEDLKVKG